MRCLSFESHDHHLLAVKEAWTTCVNFHKHRLRDDSLTRGERLNCRQLSSCEIRRSVKGSDVQLLTMLKEFHLYSCRLKPVESKFNLSLVCCKSDLELKKITFL